MSLSGWTVFHQQGKPADAVYLSYGSDNKLIAANRVNISRPDVAKELSNDAYNQSGWTVNIPTTVLPIGNNILRVWGYDQGRDRLVQLGDDINIKVLDF